MINRARTILFSLPLLAMSVVSPQALAATPIDLASSLNSVMVIPAEGNGRCSDYAANSYVKEMSSTISCPTPTSVVGGTVSGPDSVHSEDPDNVAGESAKWTYDCATKKLSFYGSSIGINYTVTKASRNITWYPYGKETFKADSEITNQDPATVVGNPPAAAILPMASFALCYDLNGVYQYVKPTALPECNNEADPSPLNAWLGAINCTTVADGTVVTLWQPLENGTGDRIHQCVCNDGGAVQTTISCDPTGASGDLQACYTKDVGQPKATTVLEFDADPITCTTSGGTRTCKCVDNPFTTLNECATQ